MTIVWTMDNNFRIIIKCDKYLEREKKYQKNNNNNNNLSENMKNNTRKMNIDLMKKTTGLHCGSENDMEMHSIY